MTEQALGTALPVWSAVPFAGVLLSIALFPLIAPRFWHHHYPKVAVFWAALFAIPFLQSWRGEAVHQIAHILWIDFVPFLALLWALFTVTGGIHIAGTLRGTPAGNTAILAAGTVCASFIGTTGASMLLIRPLLRANAARKRRVHTVVFFIFLVSNVGGGLTPLGDPPLFLGFLKGVPFFWTLSLLPEVLFAALVLLAVYYLLDRSAVAGEQRDLLRAGLSTGIAEPPARREPLRVEGGINILFLAGVAGAVLMSGLWRPDGFEAAGLHFGPETLLRESILIVMGLCSLLLTPRAVRAANEFSWEPVREVAWLFFGIFVTIIPALAMLEAGTGGPFAPLLHAVDTPSHYFWATGGLSSFLDNAPTYLAFLASALGRFHGGVPSDEALRALIDQQPQILAAISLGAVFMGANTYIGNAPNFMVRSISEQAGIGMPSFFGYILRWTVPVLIPLFLLVTLLFL